MAQLHNNHSLRSTRVSGGDMPIIVASTQMAARIRNNRILTLPVQMGSRWQEAKISSNSWAACKTFKAWLICKIVQTWMPSNSNSNSNSNSSNNSSSSSRLTSRLLLVVLGNTGAMEHTVKTSSINSNSHNSSKMATSSTFQISWTMSRTYLASCRRKGRIQASKWTSTARSLEVLATTSEARNRRATSFRPMGRLSKYSIMDSRKTWRSRGWTWAVWLKEACLARTNSTSTMKSMEMRISNLMKLASQFVPLRKSKTS